MPQPFAPRLDPATLTDLRTRLRATRWPDEQDADAWSQGTDKTYLQDLCAYWADGFDWPAQEARIASFPHFTADVDGLGLHFIHQKGTGTTSTPLLLIHGWPDSFVRFLKVIPLLTAPDKTGHSFDVVVPSQPGYGFSDIPKKPGTTPKAIAALFARLMTDELGYKKFVVHGGDWGSAVAEQMALYHESHILALHLTDVPTLHSLLPVKDPSAAEKKFLAEAVKWGIEEGAYFHEQATFPQTLGYALQDSPAGWAAWLAEKFRLWTDNDGNPEDAIPRDELLTNLTLYWCTGTITSASRIYYEATRAAQQTQALLANLNPFEKWGGKSSPPTGFALFPKDIFDPPREFAERFFNVVRWEKMPRGGHFTAWEEPDVLADDIRAIVKQVADDRKD